MTERGAKRVRFDEDKTADAKRARLADPGATSSAATGDEFEQMLREEKQTAELRRDEDWKKKHTLDSDEEDEPDDDTELHPQQEVEGAEEATIEFDENYKITPFNMREEEEEGHFDSTGTFIFNRKKDDIHDAWLDNIDWTNVKKVAGQHWRPKEQGEDENGAGLSAVANEDAENEAIDRLKIYDEMLSLMNAGETVTRALRRLGSGHSAVKSRQERWAKKQLEKKEAEKTALQASDGTTSAADTNEKTETSKKTVEEEPTSPLLKLTGLVDKLVANGEFEAYEFTTEKIQHIANCLRGSSLASSATAADAGFDMFADEVDESALQQSEEAADKKAERLNPDSEGAMWEYRWENVDGIEVHGPYNSKQMQDWVDEGYFDKGIWVRRVDRQGGSEADPKFYSSKRIDFELYM